MSIEPLPIFYTILIEDVPVNVYGPSANCIVLFTIPSELSVEIVWNEKLTKTYHGHCDRL